MGLIIRHSPVGKAIPLLIGALLLLNFGIPGLSLAQTGTSSAPNVALQPTPTPPAPAITMAAQPTPVPDIVSYKDLVEHFQRVTDLALTFIGTLVTLLGVFGIVAAYFSLKTVRDLEKLVDNTARKLDGLETRTKQTTAELESNTKKMTAEFESNTKQMLENMQEKQKLYDAATRRLQYLLEIRDKNHEVRIRAVQQLGASNDIAAVSLLADRLEADSNADVRAEAAYGLGLLLHSAVESETLAQGIQALVQGTKDKSESVRLEAVQALAKLAQNKVQMPRIALQRLREIVKHDVSADVIEAAKACLEHTESRNQESASAQQQT